jgi:two-component system nitrogen regulation sensor histidine kinase NtrY
MGSSPRPIPTSGSIPHQPHRMTFDDRVIALAVLLVAPSLLVSAAVIWVQPWKLGLKLLLLTAEVIACLVVGASLRAHVIRPLQSLANVVGALREEDYSVRARKATPYDALGELSSEVNALADMLSRQRTGAIEATALLQRVVEEVSLPILAFDPEGRLRLINSAGEGLLQQTSARLLGRTAAELKVGELLTCDNEALLCLPFASGVRWMVRHSSFRQDGVPHTLVVLSDVSRALREEERKAWQRLIRVIGHELNNSLAPISSIADSLKGRLRELSVNRDQLHDFEHGLDIIELRAASLNHFLQAYRELAQMPAPIFRPFLLSSLVQRAAALETRVQVRVVPGPDITLMGDPDQLDQMLINLLRNAADAVLQTSTDVTQPPPDHNTPECEPPIVLGWQQIDNDVVLTIEDNGPGLLNPSNVFVPFYTTKPQGSGIGLVLSRQITEAHGGSLDLTNRPGGRGCKLTLTLPLRAAAGHQPQSQRANTRE